MRQNLRGWLFASVCALALGATPALAQSSSGGGSGSNGGSTAGSGSNNESTTGGMGTTAPKAGSGTDTGNKTNGTATNGTAGTDTSGSSTSPATGHNDKTCPPGSAGCKTKQ